jgi:hypothetical protein
MIREQNLPDIVPFYDVKLEFPASSFGSRFLLKIFYLSPLQFGNTFTDKWWSVVAPAGLKR